MVTRLGTFSAFSLIDRRSFAPANSYFLARHEKAIALPPRDNAA